jgi:hypothetical protein
MKKTSAAPSSTQIVFTAENVIVINLLCIFQQNRRKGGGEIVLAAHPCACLELWVLYASPAGLSSKQFVKRRPVAVAVGFPPGFVVLVFR